MRAGRPVRYTRTAAVSPSSGMSAPTSTAGAPRAPALFGHRREDALGFGLAGHERGDPAQRGLLARERAQLGVGLAALGHVAHVAGEERRAVELRARDRDLDREAGAVGALAGQLER